MQLNRNQFDHFREWKGSECSMNRRVGVVCACARAHAGFECCVDSMELVLVVCCCLLPIGFVLSVQLWPLLLGMQKELRKEKEVL